MACTPSATSTLFGTSEVVSNSVSTETTTSTSTLPPSTVTSTETSCADSPQSSSGTCTSEVTVTITSTIPGATTTITNHFPVTFSTTLTSTFPTETLFSTCPTSQPSQPPSTGSPSSSGSSIFTSASQSTLPNGVVTTTIITYTSSPPVQTVTTPASPGLNNGDESSSNPSNLAPIIGGALGGFFGLIIFVGAYLCWRRRRRWEDIYEKDSIHGIDDDDHRPVQAPEPAPYHYGLVGHHPSPSISPPGSPTSRPVTYHSRVDSSGGVSMVSRESTVPLNARDSLLSPPLAQQAPSHPRRTSQGNDGLLLMRPLESSITQTLASTTDNSRRSVQSSAPGSPTTPRQSYFPLRVTNVDETEAGPSQGAAVQPASPKRGERKSSQSPVLVHVDGGRLPAGSTKDILDDAPPAYRK